MGKSSVLSFFRDLGAVTLDSDRIVELLLKDSRVIAGIKEILGSKVVDADGRLDKKAVADIIFRDPKLKKALEDMIHPMVMDKVDNFISKIRGKQRIVIVEVPLLFEGNYQDRFRAVITVFTSIKVALERLDKSGVSTEDALLRMKSQMPVRTKKKLADYSINNNGTKEETQRQVRKVYSLLCEEMEREAG